jgi:hypothetical protein
MFPEDGMTHLSHFFNKRNPPSRFGNIPREAQRNPLRFGDKIIVIKTRSQPIQLGPIGGAALNR